MPKLEPKAVLKELEQGSIWPVYWVYGPEKWKSREILRRIRQAVVGEELTGEGPTPETVGAGAGTALAASREFGAGHARAFEWNVDVLDGSETDVTEVLDRVRSPSLLGGMKMVVVREAHALKNLELLSELLGPPQKRDQCESICVCISKDWDGRKKFSKTLLEKTAVVSCEEVSESQRASWVQYLAKRRGIELQPAWVIKLCSQEPWSLDWIDQELEKFSVGGHSEEVFLEPTSSWGRNGSDTFLENFFLRDLKSALVQVSGFAQSPEDLLPLIGWMGWSVKQLLSFMADPKAGGSSFHSNSFLAERLRRWSPKWKLTELLQLQHELCELDFSVKQTPLLPLGLWTNLVIRYCSL